MPSGFQDLVDGFEANLERTLPVALKLWGGGLLSYVLIGLVFVVLVYPRSRPVSARSIVSSLFPPRLYADKTAGVTLRHFVLYQLLWSPLFALFSFAPTVAAKAMASQMSDLFGATPRMFDAGWMATLVQTAVIVLSMSFASYLHHYAFHRIPIFWSFHRAHHSLEAMTIPATARDHPVDLFTMLITMNVFGSFFGGLALYVTGTQLQSATFVIVGLGAMAYFILSGIFNHSHIPITFGWFNRILMSPIIHQFHHSAEDRHRDTNIGSFWGLTIWDWMFGTLYLPTREEPYRWGLNEFELGERNPHPNLREFYLEPFRDAWRLIRERGLGCFIPSLDQASTGSSSAIA